MGIAWKWGTAALGVLTSFIALWAGLSGRGPGPKWVWIIVAYAALACGLLILFVAERKERMRMLRHLLDPWQKNLLRKVRKLERELLSAMSKWPTSPAFLTPFSISWRPPVTQSNDKPDVQAMLQWHDRAVAFIRETQELVPDFFPEITAKVACPTPGIQAWDALTRFSELEETLTKKAIEE